MITELGYKWEDRIYVQCWANVLRKGQAIKQHHHWDSPYTYLGGHICLDNYDTVLIMKYHIVNYIHHQMN